jgi:hypothetical protein
MMCCKAPPIAVLKKPAGKWCPNAVFGKGCGIYANRPGACSAFYCEWLRNPSLGPEWKPDKAKLVVAFLPNFLDVWVDPSAPNAWTKPPYFAQIKQWAVEGPERGQFVLVRIGRRLIAVLPDREVDLGHVDPEARIGVWREQGPAGIKIRCRSESTRKPIISVSVSTRKQARCLTLRLQTRGRHRSAPVAPHLRCNS